MHWILAEGQGAYAAARTQEADGRGWPRITPGLRWMRSSGLIERDEERTVKAAENLGEWLGMPRRTPD